MTERWRSLTSRAGAAPVAVSALVLLALALRLPGLSQSLYGDELFTYELAIRPSLGAVLDGVRSSLEVSPPGYTILAWLFQQFGPAQFWSRAASLIAGVLLVPVVYALGLRVANRGAGLLAAALLTLSPFAIFYASEARAYSLVALLLAASTLVLLKATSEDASSGWWIVFAGLTVAAIYTHYTAFSGVAAQAVWIVLFCRRCWRPALLAFALAAVAFLPWLGEFIKDRQFLNGSPAHALAGLLAPFDLKVLLRGIGQWLVGAPYAPFSVVPGRVAIVLYAAALIIVVVGGLSAFARRWAFKIDPSVGLVSLVAVAAPIAAAGYSAIAGDLFLARYMFVSLPAMIVAIALAVVALSRPAALAATVALLIAGGLGAAASLSGQNDRPNYVAAAQVVDSWTGPGDLVVDYSGSGIFLSGPIGDQLKLNLRGPHRYYRGVPTSTPSSALLEQAKESDRLVIVIPAVKQLASPQIIPGFRLISERRLTGFTELAIYIFERSSETGAAR